MRKKIRKLLLLETTVKSKADEARTEEYIKLFGTNPDIKLTEIEESGLCEGCYLK